MSGTLARDQAPPALATGDWSVRAAGLADLPGVATGISALLGELGGSPPSEQSLRDAARVLIEDPSRGAVLVAVAGERIVGVLGASWTHAIRTTGSHGLVQELWVDPGWRSQLLGAAMIDKLAVLAREQGISRIEVGLPPSRFAQLTRTRAFYAENGFEPLGERMRLVL